MVIVKKIKELIENENKAKPLSDQVFVAGWKSLPMV